MAKVSADSRPHYVTSLLSLPRTLKTVELETVLKEEPKSYFMAFYFALNNVC